MTPEPRQIPSLGGGRGHDQKPRFAFTGNRQIGLNATELIEPLRVDDPADRNGDVIGADPIEDRFGVGSLQEVLSER